MAIERVRAGNGSFDVREGFEKLFETRLAGKILESELMRKLIEGAVNLKHTLSRRLATIPLINSQYCCLCNSKIGQFLPYRKGTASRAPLMTALNVVGSDIDNFSCPLCGCHDRERHLYLYMSALGILNKMTGARVLHFAPEIKLREIIERQRPENYVKADLYPAASDIEKINMLKIPYANESFDYVIANHVLEHVDDYAQALSEIRRVLVRGGFAILQTPYSQKLQTTFSDPGVNDDVSRLNAYGQEDHLRLFGKDIFSLFAASGLEPHIQRHKDVLGEKDAKFYGVNLEEPFFLFERSE